MDVNNKYTVNRFGTRMYSKEYMQTPEYMDRLQKRATALREIRAQNALDNQRDGAKTITLAAVVALGVAFWLTLAFHEAVPQVFIAAFFWSLWGGASVLAWAGWADYRDMKRRFEKEFG